MLVALYTHGGIYASDSHHRYTFNSIYLLLASLFLENLPVEANVLTHTCNVPLFFILFLTLKFICWSIFDMQLIHFT